MVSLTTFVVIAYQARAVIGAEIEAIFKQVLAS
jgi:hypothetical protein